MAQWGHQSVAVYSQSGSTLNKTGGEGNNNFTLSDGEIGGADSLTFESGDILDSGFFVSGDLFYVGTVEFDGETFIVGQRTSTGNFELYSSQPLQSPTQFPASFDESLIDTSAFTVCFATGTMIETTQGSRAVEELRIGDKVVTTDGASVPVKWIGRQTVSPRFGPAERLLPIRICAHALDENVPARDLVVSADHGMLIDGMIVHAGALVNGTSIQRVPLTEVGPTLTYWHIETDAHDIVLAEGAPAETFIDNVSRAAFDNYAEFVSLYGADVSDMAPSTLPRVLTTRQLPSATRARLAGRAGLLASGSGNRISA